MKIETVGWACKKELKSLSENNDSDFWNNNYSAVNQEELLNA
jgi:hypothetical protein